MGSVIWVPILYLKCKAAAAGAVLLFSAAAATADVLLCYETVIPPHCSCLYVNTFLRDCNLATEERLVILGIHGNAQHATATARHGMRPSGLLVASPSLSTHCAERG